MTINENKTPDKIINKNDTLPILHTIKKLNVKA